MPPVLIVHMKRFQYERGIYGLGHIRSKISELVDFPVTGLDLSAIAVGVQDVPPIYDLFAVSDHSGDLGGGHYTAYAQNFLNKQWYYFNDSGVSPATSKSAVQSSAYVLFYRRREPGAPPPADALATVGGAAASVHDVVMRAGAGAADDGYDQDISMQ
jgi:ubiquitin carboxyl-terminal hydrolase 4/11